MFCLSSCVVLTRRLLRALLVVLGCSRRCRAGTASEMAELHVTLMAVDEENEAKITLLNVYLI